MTQVYHCSSGGGMREEKTEFKTHLGSMVFLSLDERERVQTGGEGGTWGSFQ